ncbi:hypothetical protein BV22DRAFT_8306 [Leucogyrophana mollusca]|uniref:Uncharacterized protein n=1 Tax=Leucogyrophana mollusca TaxID=85980 RepID=A0ACB8C0W2_9AGAM|nr:hypothetical protein BV22DRAFT_8306 [Leucogyrophana mollusca]
MVISNPTQLIDEFKKSGEFDRLRRELLTEFQNSDRIGAFKSRVEDIARQRLASDQKLQSMPHDAVHRELMGEMDRYPIVERAVTDAPLLSDPSFTAAIRSSIQRILEEAKKSSSRSPANTDAKDTGVADPTINVISMNSSSTGQETST